MSIKKANENNQSVRKDMRVEKELLSMIDSVRGDVPFSAWVKRAAIMRLENEGHTVQVQKESKLPEPKNNSSNKEALKEKALKLQSEGYTHQQITDIFNDEGLMSLTGKEWTRGSVGNLLRK